MSRCARAAGPVPADRPSKSLCLSSATGTGLYVMGYAF